MTDLDALRQAVLAAPADDLPRLVFADCLEENGDPDRAAFVRAQIALAKTPEYEPFAVLCKTRRRDWVTGEPWQSTLEPLLPAAVVWPANGFRRGFGWAVRARYTPALLGVAPSLFDREPVGELHLGTATLDQWERLAESDWLPRIRSLTLGGLTSPNEPLRALRHSPLASGVRELRFEHTNVPSMPEILEELFAAPLGRQLTALSMRLGYGSADETAEVLAAGRVGVTDYTFERMGFGPAAVRTFTDSGLAALAEVLRLVGNPVMAGGAEILATAADRLRILDLSETYLDESAADALAGSPNFRGLRKLVLNQNADLKVDGVKAVARSPHLAGLRSLGLAVTGADNAAVRYLTRGTFWPTLVELDLTGNPISDAGAKHLMTARPAAELTSLRLPARNLSDGMIADLRAKFGEVVGFAE